MSDITVYRRIPPAECAALSVNDAAAYVGCGRSTIYNLAADGLIKLSRARGRTVVVRQSLDDYLLSHIREAG